MDNRTLKNGKMIPNIMFGSFQMTDQQEMNEIVSAAVENGVLGFDTSPSYRTEGMLATAVHNVMKTNPAIKREKFFIETKIDSWQMIAKKGEIRPFVTAKLKETKLQYWDCLLIHWPQPEYLVPTWKAMEKLYEEKLVRSIGVCNFSPRHFRTLQKGGAKIMPHICQSEIHPLNAEEELTAYCKEHGIILEAYSPLCRMIPQMRYNALINILAEKYHVSPAQIILRWHIEHGRVPIVKTSSVKRVKENTDIFSFSLSEEDCKAIHQLNEDFHIFLESRCCPGY